MPFVQHDPRRLVWQQNDRYLWIEPWGENSLRVRSGRHLPVMRYEDWALTEPVAESHCGDSADRADQSQARRRRFQLYRQVLDVGKVQHVRNGRTEQQRDLRLHVGNVSAGA